MSGPFANFYTEEDTEDIHDPKRRRLADQFGSKDFQQLSKTVAQLREQANSRLGPDKQQITEQIAAQSADLKEIIDAFIEDENHIVDDYIGDWPDRSKANLETIRRNLIRLTPASEQLSRVATQALLANVFCTNKEYMLLTSTQQAVFAACNPRLAWRMPAFAIAAQPGAGKTLMSVLGCVRWVLGGVAELRHYQKQSDAPRPFIKFKGDGTFRFVQPSTATCMYVVPKAVLPQTVANFARFAASFGLIFETRPAQLADLYYRWDADPMWTNICKENPFIDKSIFQLQECEDYWFAPMTTQQLQPLTKDNMMMRIHDWTFDTERTKVLQGYYTEGFQFTPAVLRYGDEYTLRIAFFAIEDLLRDNLNWDQQECTNMTVGDYMQKELRAYRDHGLQLFATPRVRYMVCDEFHMPLEQVTVKGALIENYFAYPGASNLLNLIGSKTLNSHVFSNTQFSGGQDAAVISSFFKDPKNKTVEMYKNDLRWNGYGQGLTTEIADEMFIKAAKEAGKGKEVKDFHTTDKLLKAAELINSEVERHWQHAKDFTDRPDDDFGFQLIEAIYKHANSAKEEFQAPLRSSNSPYFGYGHKSRAYPVTVSEQSGFQKDYFGTQTLLMTGTPPNPEATALWLALVQPAPMLKTGGQGAGYVLQTIVYDKGYQTEVLRPAFLWRYDAMTSACPEKRQLFTPEAVTSDKTDPKEAAAEPVIGYKKVKEVCDGYSVFVRGAANSGAVIAFVGSAKTTPYWHYEFVRGYYPTLAFTADGLTVLKLDHNGAEGSPCPNFAGSANSGSNDKLYNTMLYGQMCPTRVVPTNEAHEPVELEDWQNVWRTIKMVLAEIATEGALINPERLISDYGRANHVEIVAAEWTDQQKGFLNVIKENPRVVIVYGGPAGQWPVFLDSVPEDQSDDGGSIGWLTPSAFYAKETLQDAVQHGAPTSGGGTLRTTPPEGFIDDDSVAKALDMGVENPGVNLFVLNAHSSTGIDLPGINVVIYVGDQGNKEQMLSRSSRLCKAMQGVQLDGSDDGALGSFVVIQILPEATKYSFANQDEVLQREALTTMGIEKCLIENACK